MSNLCSHIACALLTLCVVFPAHAGRTDPELALTRVQAVSSGAGILLRFEGLLHTDDLVQLAFPLQLLIWGAAGQYVRVDVSGGGVTGVAPELAGGLGPVDALALVGQGSAVPGVAVSHISPGRIDVLLPAGLVTGPATAAVFAVEDGEATISNSLPLVVPGSAQ